MREIKFRAWDKKMKQLIYWNFICVMLNGHPINVPRKEKRIACVGGDEVPSIDIDYKVYRGNPFEIFKDNLMQYTGLKDKKGVEIYEGDIVNRYSDELKGTISEGGYKKGDLMVTGPIVYKENICAFVQHLGLDFKLKTECDLEVIGNIYENEELLTN